MTRVLSAVTSMFSAAEQYVPCTTHIDGHFCDIRCHEAWDGLGLLAGGNLHRSRGTLHLELPVPHATRYVALMADRHTEQMDPDGPPHLAASDAQGIVRLASIHLQPARQP